MAAPLSQLPDEERDRAFAGALPEDLPPLPDDDFASKGEITENPDGSATITLPEEDKIESNFSDNLAEVLPESYLRTVAAELLDLVEKDKQSRAKRDEQYEEGLRRSGLGDDAPGGAEFEGASKVVHPVLAESCVDFAASAMKELCPPDGPVKIATKNNQFNPAQLERAGRKRDLLNELFTQHMSEYYDEKEVMLSQLPMGGSQYETYYFDPQKGRACMEFWPVDKCYLPFAASSFYTAARRTRVLELTRSAFEGRVRSGLYRDITIAGNEPMPEESLSEKANNKIEGREADSYNEDGLRTLYEIKVQYSIDDDNFTGGDVAPYIITIDEPTMKIVAVYRNWRENDEAFQELEWDVEDKFIPWRGVYGIGLPHLIGSLAGALTGALRALLDSAHINNAPAAAKLKGGRFAGQNLTISPTEVVEIEAPAGVDDVRKVMMPMPFNPPSPVLFQLLGWLTDAAKGVVATAEEKISEASNQMPVGTAMALIEQGSKVFSSIHARLHKTQARAIRIVCRLIAEYPEGIHAKLLQKYQLTPQDFADWTDIEPVSDPNIFSESQRYAQWQSAMQLAAQAAQNGVKVDMYSLTRRGYELLRWPDIDTILPKPPEPITADPVQENQQCLLTGAQIKAVPEQDHVSHIQEHVRFILDPMGGAGPLFQGQQLQPILANITQHVLYLYEKSVETAGVSLFHQAAAGGEQPNPELLISRAAAAASQIIARVNPQLPQQIDQAFKIVASKMPQGPMDPVQATLQAAMAETQRKAQADQTNAQLKMKELEGKSQEQIQTMQSWVKEQENALNLKMMDLEQKRIESAQDYHVKVEELKQAYIKLEQEAAKIGMDKVAAIQGMVDNVDRVMAPLTSTLPENMDQNSLFGVLQQVLEQQRADQNNGISGVNENIGRLLEAMQAKHEEDRAHRQSMVDMAQRILSEQE